MSEPSPSVASIRRPVSRGIMPSIFIMSILPSDGSEVAKKGASGDIQHMLPTKKLPIVGMSCHWKLSWRLSFTVPNRNAGSSVSWASSKSSPAS